MPLTDVKCKSAKPKEKPYKLSDSQGLYLEVLPSGGKYWRMKYYFHGKEKRVSFGVYPQISLAEAREKQLEAKKQLANGINPVQAKADKKLADAVKHMNNFEAIAREWHEKNKETWVERHRENIMARLERDVFPVIGHRPIADITTPELKTVLDKIEARKAYDIAKRTRQVCDQIYRYAIGIGIAERNIARDLQGTLKKVEATHFASITIEELPEFLKRINANAGRHFPSTLHATKLMLLTFVRTAELRGAYWSEIDFENKRWEIPASRMKSKRAHIVPLSHQAIILLRSQKELAGASPYVFPNQANPKKVMSENTILKVIANAGYKGMMTGHGFRSLAMTAIREKLGYDYEIPNLQLAHGKKDKLQKAYDKSKFLPERTKMMQQWADYVEQFGDISPVPYSFSG